MKVSPIYTETVKHLNYGARRIVHQGGTWSGKTVNILGALATVINDDEEPSVNTVTSMSFPHLKGGALRDFENYVYPTFKAAIKKYHQTDHIFTFRNNSILEFKVFETEMDARGPKRKRLFINEANKFDWLRYYHLDGRSEQSVIDYNPSIRFWGHERVIGEEGTVLLISDHRHNPFITESKHKEIESQKDPELWKVYARGLTGNVTGVIFPDWEMIDDNNFPTTGDYTFGIDFGYTVDPTAIFKICKIGDTIFVDEIAYEPGLSLVAQQQLLFSNGYTEDTPCFCDGADPEQIRGLRMVGIRAEPARKGPGSIKAGIELLKSFKVKYTSKSRNLKREQGMYVWTTDKVSGNATNVPVDNNNHCFDAIRYAVFSRYLRNQS